LASAGEVKDLGVVGVNIAGSGDYIGGLVGVSGSGRLDTGGGIVTRCYSTGAVSGVGSVGGLVGEINQWGTVTQCYGTATVMGTVSHVGGLVGLNRGSVTQCYSTGAVSGNWGVGGLAGGNGDTVTQCYSTGAVSGKYGVGGLVGYNTPKSSVTQCYSTGTVSGTGQYSFVGGLVGLNTEFWGDNEGIVTECFWDSQTSGQTVSAAGTGKTTAEMQTAKTFLDAGWDFVGETPNGSENIWKIAEGLGYPRLAWEKYSGGSGTAQDPYQIATAADLIALGETPEDYDKHFIMTADIDMDPKLPGRKVFDKAVIVSDAPYVSLFWGVFPATLFAGVFDANRHTISHLTIRGENDLGVFAYLGSGAKISDLGVVDANVSGSGCSVGGLVGYNLFGDITRCYSTGAVSGTEEVGGLVGFNVGSVTQSYSTAAVSGTVRVGGLAGINGIGGLGGRPGIATQCYSTGGVSGDSFVGGLVGDNKAGTVSQCYSTGTVRSRGTGEYSGWSVGGLVGSNNKEGAYTRACFWDTQTSGQATSAGGTGKATAEMHTARTFLEAGWGFVGETANGTEDLWWILEGKDYPRLWWELNDELKPNL
jgi:hypothetical protein